MTLENARKLDNQLFLVEWLQKHLNEAMEAKKQGLLSEKGEIFLEFVEHTLKQEVNKYDKMFEAIKAYELRRPSNHYNGRGWLS